MAILFNNLISKVLLYEIPKKFLLNKLKSCITLLLYGSGNYCTVICHMNVTNEWRWLGFSYTNNFTSVGEAATKMSCKACYMLTGEWKTCILGTWLTTTVHKSETHRKHSVITIWWRKTCISLSLFLSIYIYNIYFIYMHTVYESSHIYVYTMYKNWL